MFTIYHTRDEFICSIKTKKSVSLLQHFFYFESFYSGRAWEINGMFVGDANAEITNRWGKTCVDTCQSVANNQNARCTDELGNVDWCYRPHCSDYSRMYPGSNGLEMSFYARYKPNNIQVCIF